MKRMGWTRTAAAALAALLIAAQPARTEDREGMTEEMAKISAANNRFALELYQRLAGEDAENLFFSPSSISTAFAMAYGGARGETAQQMAEVLHFPLPQDQLHAGLEQLNAAIAGQEQKDYRLNIANRLWGQQGFGFLPEFLRITREHYRAELAELDFARQPEAARQQINQWVAEQTQQKITDLIPPGVLDEMTRLVLTNAIYFKGQWTSPFDPRMTQDAPFHLASGQTVEVPMMRQKDDFQYFASEQLQVLRLPYGQQKELSMIILLPSRQQQFTTLEQQLSPEQLDQWIAALQKREVRVEVPRFRMTSQFQLKPTLASMGMTEAFTPDAADFSGMNGRRDLYIAAAIHKAFVEVNEEGTEAAAATGIVVGITSAPAEPPPLFRADRPFLFLIQHAPTGTVLFLGRVTNPPE